jgi:hypothetical protein
MALREVVLYECGTWFLTKGGAQIESRVLRRILDLRGRKGQEAGED